MREENENVKLVTAIVRNIDFPAILDNCWHWRGKNHQEGRRMSWQFYRVTGEKTANVLAVKLKDTCKESCINPDHLVGVYKNS